MIPTTLDLDTLRTLAVAEDLRGYGQAAARLGRTPSAVSLQMKRLQDDVGVPLFRKSGRGLALTEAGETVLRYARRMLELNDELLGRVRGAALAGTLRLGMPQDFADTVLPAALAEFTALHPLVQMEVRVEGSADLVAAVDAGQLDLALAVGLAERRTAETVGEVALAWIAGRRFRRARGQPLPLLALGPRCAFRQAAIRGLEAAGVPWRLAASSTSLHGLWAAAAGGLGVTVRSTVGLPPQLVAAPTLFGLPALGRFPVTLHAAPDAAAGVHALRAVVAAVLARALEAPAGRRGLPRPRQGARRHTETGTVPSGVAGTR